jgi:hypothetical protein
VASCRANQITGIVVLSIKVDQACFLFLPGLAGQGKPGEDAAFQRLTLRQIPDRCGQWRFD